LKFRTFFAIRLFTCLLTIWIGATIIFFIPRFMPSDPVESMIGVLIARSGQMTPDAIEGMRKQLNIQFGLDGTLWEQYVSYLKNGLLRWDFGPSLMAFPMPVTEIIGRNLPYTLFLMMGSTILAWVIGNTIGLLAGFMKDRFSSKAMESVAIFLYPIPYFLVALVLQIVFSFILQWFPLQSVIYAAPGSPRFFAELIHVSLLPGLSMFLIGMGWWIISMKALSSTTAAEDFVLFARYRGLSEGTIGSKYVFRNSALPQITALGLSIGGVFGGAIMTEVIFNYPGVGTLLRGAIILADYNMILGCVTISIVAISVITLLIDLILPFFDPRVRYG